MTSEEGGHTLFSRAIRNAHVLVRPVDSLHLRGTLSSAHFGFGTSPILLDIGGCLGGIYPSRGLLAVLHCGPEALSQPCVTLRHHRKTARWSEPKTGWTWYKRDFVLRAFITLRLRQIQAKCGEMVFAEFPIGWRFWHWSVLASFTGAGAPKPARQFMTRDARHVMVATVRATLPLPRS